MDRSDIPALQRQYAGLWVAIRGDELIDARPNPDALVLALEEKGIMDATIFRCPAENEPELVGLG